MTLEQAIELLNEVAHTADGTGCDGCAVLDGELIERIETALQNHKDGK